MATKKTAAKAPAKTAAKKSAVKAPAKTAAAKSAPQAEAPAAAKTPATHKQIADLAHKYFTERGHGHGSHVADWLRAEKELNS